MHLENKNGDEIVSQLESMAPHMGRTVKNLHIYSLPMQIFCLLKFLVIQR